MEIQFVKNEDHYVVKKGKSFFKLGLLEGNILKAITEQRDPIEIQNEFLISMETYQQLIEQFEKVGIIGEAKKEKFDILWMKFPLLNPDRFLEWLTSGFVKNKGMTKFLFWSINAFMLYALWFFFQEHSAITEAAMTQFSGFQLLACYLTGLFCIFLHELGHGFVCKYFNGKVEKIGVMLIFFSPAMYCDVSDAYLFKKKRHKVYVALAGLYVNVLIVCVLAMFWKFNHEPSLQGYLSWMLYMNVGVILMNSIPFVKLDGYWVLAHATGISNLFTKSLKRFASVFISSMKAQAASPREDRFLIMYGAANMVMLCVFLYLGLHGLYFLSVNDIVALPIRILVIVMQGFVYVFFAVKTVQFIVRAIRGRKENKAFVN